MFRPLDDTWQRCPRGELGRLADRLRLRRWAGAALGTIVALLAAAAVAFSGWQTVSVLVPSPSPPAPHCITCPSAVPTATERCHVP
jgi:hypothetical protein